MFYILGILNTVFNDSNQNYLQNTKLYVLADIVIIHSISTFLDLNGLCSTSFFYTLCNYVYLFAIIYQVITMFLFISEYYICVNVSH